MEPSTFHISHSQKGASLIEIIISMFLLMVLFVLYISAQNTVVSTRKLRYENIAYHAANKKMEELRGTPLEFLSASGAISDPMLSQIPSGGGNFVVADHIGFSGLKELTVTVTWYDGINKQVQLKSLAGSGGINP